MEGFCGRSFFFDLAFDTSCLSLKPTYIRQPTHPRSPLYPPLPPPLSPQGLVGDTVDDVNDPNYQGRGKGTPNTAKCVRVRFVGSRNKNKRGGGSGGGGGDDAGDFGEGGGAAV